MSEIDKRWQFWIDRGGTFTDIVGLAPDGFLQTHKLLSENPERYQDAAIQGMREMLNLSAEQPLSDHVEVIKMGTTVGTNALLERKGEPTVLLITKGLGDCLRIGYQNRPDIFALDIQLPTLLYVDVIEINERLNVQGQVLQTLDIGIARQQLQNIFDQSIRSVAIVLMHAWRYPQHEQQLAKLAAQIGFTQISVSHQVSPLMKIVSRGDTSVVDAYLSPLLKRYVRQISNALSLGSSKFRTRLMFMQSNGGLVTAEQFQGKDSILSGPAGGLIGAVAVAKKAGIEHIIAFDMGGTSTDVAHYAGEFERSFETEVAGVRMRAPMMHIHTVAAGGGSILKFDGMRYRVGPESAGAHPGPACYRNGGPLTVTDANLMLGKLPLFPAVFGPEANLSLDQVGVNTLFQQLAEQISRQTGDKRNALQVAEGFLDIAVENMANAIKKVSVQKGYDVSTYTLCCYGAAGGQHACKVADRLGIAQILIHPFAGILSAYGMGLADFRVLKQQAIESLLSELDIQFLQQLLEQLQQAGQEELLQQGLNLEQLRAEHYLFIRFEGTDTAIQVDFSDFEQVEGEFYVRYRQQFGFCYRDKPLIVEKALVEIIGKDYPDMEGLQSAKQQQTVGQKQTTELFSGNQHYLAPVYQRSELGNGELLRGPAVIVEATGTTVIEPGWQAQVSPRRDLILSRAEPINRGFALGTTVDPVMLEIFNQLFMSIAEQMGFVLQNTAYSVNIKERLDFSCAVFDGVGQLVANAPHIPVHLGSMGDSVQALMDSQRANMLDGDVYLLNSPYQGGTHLPDITVVTPLFDQAGQNILFVLASRGHHADIGGVTPGSMPSDSIRIEQEGVISAGLKIVHDGVFMQDVVRSWLTSGTCPARNPDQNIADLQAQIAANEKGVKELQQLVENYTLATVKAYMQFVQDNAEEAVRRVILTLREGSYIYATDNGAQIAVTIKIDIKQRSAIVDFTGTSAQQHNNFNAPASVCKAAVLYVFRTLVKDNIPLNAGCLKPLHLIIPEASMLNPQQPAAVVAGNVETSQIIVDTLYGALGVLAGSQGTMNNLTFGNQQYQYYETICGGTGAGPGFNGTDAVQSHMTNSRITDPEVLEWRFPVLLEAFSIRRGSGGQGQYQGGDGVLRRIRFLTDMTVNILSGNRAYQPFGVNGGQSGCSGLNTLIIDQIKSKQLAGCVRIDVKQHDVIQIETPGGGGYGTADPE